ncbi:MAG: putative DNA-binding domain-containing protein [Hyphomicrobiales bacterium]|nr:putative DNA-binding domain-containing protein [Hyphomicrobiales bacterium]
MTDAPELARLQARFQKAVLDGDDDILAEINDSTKENRNVLFGVYRNAYVLRLIEILSIDFEHLHGYLGDENFGRLARDYIAAHPSPHRNARWFGARLAEFVATTAPWSAHKEVGEIAAIETALNNAFDAADSTPLNLAALGAVVPEDWPRLIFSPHPSARRLDLDTNALAIWMAVKNEEEPPSVEHHEKAKKVLVWRADLTSKIRVLPDDEAMMWDEMARGVPFGTLCELLATYWDAESAPGRAAGYLQGWITAELLAASE